MKAIKFFESVDERISFQSVTPTIDGKEQKKELLILLESPYTKKKDIVMTFDTQDAFDIANEIINVFNSLTSSISESKSK